MIYIQIHENYINLFPRESITKILNKALLYLGKSDHEVSLVIEENTGIQILNREYRHIDAPTDVLSFVYNTIDPETSKPYLGDIIISGDKVVEQARQAGHSQTMELNTLIIHGILHLCGYDHETDADEAVMKPLQEKMIKEIYSNEP